MKYPALRRFTGLLRKEFLQILRDPSALAIAFVLPAVLLLIIGQGVSLDARHVPVAIVVQNPDGLTASFTGHFEQSPYFRPFYFLDIQSAEVAMADSKVHAIVWLPSNFSRRAKAQGNSPIGVIVNGVDANDARLVEGYVQQVWSTWLTAQARLHGKRSPLPIDVAARVRFNPGVSSRDYLVPGLIALIMTLTGALLTALVMAREWERGTLEALMVTRVKMREILLAKLVPYFLLGMGGMAASVAIAVFLFGIPLRGSLLVLTGTSALFMLAALGMGLLISSFAKNQFVAGQIAIITTFLPAFILSGFVFDIESMPPVVQFITHIVAARYFVAILQSLFLAGDVWSVILPNALALVIMAVTFLVTARAITHKRLD